MLTLGTGLGVLILIIGISIFSINRYSAQLLDMNKNAIFNDYDKNVKNQVENVISLLESIRKYQLANNFTDEQGKNLAVNWLED
jgi:ABC-type lipoprotein release transport system permease subunit